ncbi:hypothetical protein [Candidatus Soleaferrea massiliensis]|uniref:hypothetical protein n=1 Tax=Candidatus Soleaferrea massiliensis TaxID=1470354 RepID=UPI0012E06E6E|nr:hypothetical protein [Candidatus Soleaferrea massiliensis]
MEQTAPALRQNPRGGIPPRERGCIHAITASRFSAKPFVCLKKLQIFSLTTILVTFDRTISMQGQRKSPFSLPKKDNP